ncbi:MAG: ORF6N domain-containing protein [Bacteroidaceae bacterium]|nr:ORF6N domain-containing protein [Bacteroidaceae bacterium]
MNDIELIQNKIYEIRGQRVMLDFDLAEMYAVETRVLNQAVKRNIERFPPDFMFQLTNGELEILRSQLYSSENTENKQHKDWTSQFVISNSTKMGLRRAPYAFTELGVAMLSSVLRSALAIQVNINIMRAFVIMRKAIASDNELIFKLEDKVEKLSSYIEEILVDQNDINEETRMQLDAITIALAELQAKPKEEKLRRRIGFIQDDK